MLPVFQIRELGQDVQLDEKIQYDELIVDHPVATLGYVDDDDGEVITVSLVCIYPDCSANDDNAGRFFIRTLRPYR